LPHPSILKDFRGLIQKYFLEPLVLSRNPPRLDAMGVAVGLVVGLGTPVGLHSVAVGLCRLMFRFNLLAGLAFTWVCNPINMFPLYYIYYRLGSLLLNRPAEMNFVGFRELMDCTADQSYCWETVAEFAKLGQDLVIRWLVGAEVLAIIFGTVGYLVTYRIQANRCRRAADRLGIGYAQYISDLETRAEVSPAPSFRNGQKD
jgi:uncharacterized protein